MLAQPRICLEVLYAEFWPGARGDTGPRDDWFERFPDYRHEFERLLQVHDQIAISPPEQTALAPASLVLQSSATWWIGRHEILKELGRGGMGVVYLARQPHLDRLVALKMILAGDHANAHEMTRFRAEAQTVARLQHPNIVQIFEVGEHDGRPFLAFEFIPGGSLDKQLHGKPWSQRPGCRSLASHLPALSSSPTTTASCTGI